MRFRKSVSGKERARERQRENDRRGRKGDIKLIQADLFEGKAKTVPCSIFSI